MQRFAKRSGRACADQPRKLAVLVVLLTAVGLVGCGNSPTPAPSASGEASEPATPPTPAPASETAAPESPAPSESSTPSGSAAAVDACALLPTALLANVLGGDIAFPTPIPSAGWSAGQCAWNGETSNFILRVGTAASISAFADPAAPDAKAMLAAFKEASPAGSAKDVAGVGDGAVVSTTGIAGQVADDYIEITRLRLTDEQLIEILKMAIANL